MSEKYQPKVGDRVRVVLEGEVTYVSASGFYINEGPFFSNGASEVVSVEKVVPPLPTTPGSVIRARRGDDDGPWYWTLQDDGLWDDYSPVTVAAWRYDVIFDAGAAK